MLSEFATKHASNIPVTFVTLKRFAVLFFLQSCCVNSLSLPPPLSTLLIDSTVLRRKNCTLIRDCVSTFWRHCLFKYGQSSLSQAKLKFNLKPLLLYNNYPRDHHELYVWINCIFKRNYYDKILSKTMQKLESRFKGQKHVCLFVCFHFGGKGEGVGGGRG